MTPAPKSPEIVRAEIYANASVVREVFWSETLFGIRDSRFSADQKLTIAGAANVHSRFANSDLFLPPRIYN